ncbi:MAG: HD-GYP domain-containing protein [Chloroflexi bacterium]|nr:HD-GYP domain-containing protein [Chloroflexota bacterium]
MHVRDLSSVRPGNVLARAVFTERGDVLLAEGTVLTEAYVEALRQRGFFTVHVEDGLSDDVRPVDIVSAQVRASTAAHVARMFEIVAVTAGVMPSRAPSSGAGARPSPSSSRGRSAGRPTDQLGDRVLQLPSDGMSMLEALYRDIERIMAEILGADAVASLESLKTHSDYTFEHSVEVAIVAIVLGRNLGLPDSQIRELALGALLHDIGKVYIDPAIVNKPGRLTLEEFEEIKKHPLLGFELVRRLPLFSTLPAHVAYQHHEKQDGSGYPRQLVGNNRILRLEADRLRPTRILLIAEIAAVADVFCALASARPYKPAFPLDRVAVMLRQIAGSHLNHDVVSALLSTVPMYAIGHWIEVVTGPYRGWRGVVTGVDAATLHLPQIRLHLDARRNAVHVPVEADLRQHADWKIVCLPPGEEPTAPPLEQRGVS